MVECTGRTTLGATETFTRAGSATKDLWGAAQPLCLNNKRVEFVGFTLKITSLTNSGAILAPREDLNVFISTAIVSLSVT